MAKKIVTYAFIDSQNLNLGIRELGWKLDYAKFRVYLWEKYGVEKAFLFIGYVVQNVDLYTHLQDAGYICIFKPTLVYKDGTTKDSCDAELVLHTMIQFDNFDGAMIISGDGDFQCLAKYLYEQGKLSKIVVPNQKKYSALLKFDIFKPHLRFVSDLRTKLKYTPKKKNPRKDKTLKGKTSTGDGHIIAKSNKSVNKTNKKTRTGGRSKP